MPVAVPAPAAQSTEPPLPGIAGQAQNAAPAAGAAKIQPGRRLYFDLKDRNLDYKSVGEQPTSCSSLKRRVWPLEV